MPATGKNFGLKQDWWVDNRRNVTAATNAALDYLQKLHRMFGNWDLALAAYNAGEGTVQRAIDRNRKNGLPTDYASLQLPAETKNYVPKLQAIKNIMKQPENYGLNIDKIPNRPYFNRVIAPEQIDAKLAASLAEISYDEFVSLNPEYNRPVITETGNAHEILLPVSAAITFKTNLASYDKPLISWQTYHAKRGERMDKIAQKFGINVSQLRDVNDISSGKKLSSSQPILVPNNARNSDNTPLDTNTAQLQNENQVSHGKQKGKSTVRVGSKKKEASAKKPSRKKSDGAKKSSSSKKTGKHQASN
jgi:membrane-bound lytic murein transglycosylase D